MELLTLSEALSRVVPFIAKEDNRPILRCVVFRVKDGKLAMVSADGFRLAMVKLDFNGDEGQVLINLLSVSKHPSYLTGHGILR